MPGLDDPLPAVRDPARLSALRAEALLDTEDEPVFDRLTRLAGRLLGVPVALVSLVDHDRQQFKSGAPSLPEPWASMRETPLSHSFCQHVVALEAPLLVGDAREDPVLRDNLAVRDLSVVAYAGVPLHGEGGEVLGSFCAIDSAPRAWSEEDLGALRDLAELAEAELRLRARTRQSARNAQILADAFARERALTTELLVGLLPSGLPSAPGLTLAGGFRPAEGGIGGDWYDALRLADGRIAIAIGDVVGRGQRAAAAGGRLRVALRGRLAEGLDAAACVEALSHLAAGDPGAAASTCVVAIIEPVDHLMTWARAGHLPPVLIRPDGTVVLLEERGAPPLGVAPGTAIRAGRRRLAAGERLVLCTDGLVERRDEPLDAGLQRLAGLAWSFATADEVVEHALLSVPPDADDDVALVVVDVG